MTDATMTETTGGQQEAAVAPAEGRGQESIVSDDGGREESARRVEARRESEQVDADGLRREAATRRRQLRAVEQERDDIAADRDRLAVRVDRMDRAEVERLAAERLHDAADIWHAVELAELRSDDGEVDAERVQAALDRIAERHAHWCRPTPARQRQPVWPAGAVAPPPEPDGFGARLKQAVTGHGG